jgi:hypothetical protein
MDTISGMFTSQCSPRVIHGTWQLTKMQGVVVLILQPVASDMVQPRLCLAGSSATLLGANGERARLTQTNGTYAYELDVPYRGWWPRFDRGSLVLGPVTAV